MDLGSIQDSQSDTAEDMISFEEEDLDETVQALAHVINRNDPIQVKMLEIIKSLKAREEALSKALSEVQELKGHAQANLETAVDTEIPNEETSIDVEEHGGNVLVQIRAGASEESDPTVNME